MPFRCHSRCRSYTDWLTYWLGNAGTTTNRQTVLITPKYPRINQTTQKLLAKFSYPKNPGIENFKPKTTILWRHVFRQRQLKTKTKKRRIFWNTKFSHRTMSQIYGLYTNVSMTIPFLLVFKLVLFNSCKVIRIPASKNFCLWNSECWALESGIQLKDSGTPLVIGIRNPGFTDKESGFNSVESRIQDCLGFLYTGRYDKKRFPVILQPSTTWLSFNRNECQ